MTKQDFIINVAERIDADCTQARNVTAAVFDAVAQLLADGDKILIPGFGTFSVSTRKARAARNPRTGEPMNIPEQNVPSFKPAKALKNSVNKES